MDTVEQVTLVNQFMIGLAPVVARYTLRDIMRPDYFATEELLQEHHVRLAERNANLTMELASHLAARFAQYHDAATSVPQKKDSFKALIQTHPQSEQTKANKAA
jgi:hypothetical protein